MKIKINPKENLWQPLSLPSGSSYLLDDYDFYGRVELRPSSPFIPCCYCRCYNTTIEPMCTQCGAPMNLSQGR
jgi:hypothetical protein